MKKRAYFREAFDGFDYNIIAQYGEQKVAELLENKGIIRNKLKINSAISNAQSFIKIQKEFGSFSKYIWNFTGGKPIVNSFAKSADIPYRCTKITALAFGYLLRASSRYLGLIFQVS